MSNVDERIVEMRFDNQQFEKGISTTIASLGKLTQALKLDKALDGIGSISKAIGNVSFSAIDNNVQALTNRFSVLGTMGARALEQITDKAVNAATGLVKTMSGVDNLMVGWGKFGDKTTSVATLVSQGYDLEVVNEQLSKLNWFTDETSYNFTDMVSNIAKFTAAGQDLETSVKAMEGIANWAALSGQNATTASRAMYQLSQAMGKGALKYDDYKSIQNASMDTQEFRQKALDAAVAAGTLAKQADGLYKVVNSKDHTFGINQFTEYLSDDMWFTKDVMMDVFGQYSAAVDQLYSYTEEHGVTASEAIEALGDNVDAFGLKAFRAAQEARTWGDVIDSVKDAVSTGWMNTFELIFGNYEEAKTMWTYLANEFYDVFAEGGNARNEILSIWKEAGGRDDLIKGLKAIWEGFRAISEMARNAFVKVFPFLDRSGDLAHEQANKLLGLTKSISDFGQKFKASVTGITEKVKTVTEVVEEAQKFVMTAAQVNDLAKQVIHGDFGNGQERIRQLRELGVSYELVQNRVNELLDCQVRHDPGEWKIVETEEELKALTETTKETTEQVETTTDVIRILTNIFEGAAGVISLVERALKDFNRIVLKQTVFPVVIQELKTVFVLLGRFGKQLATQSRRILKYDTISQWFLANQEKFKAATEGLASAFHILRDIFIGIFNAASSLITGIFPILLQDFVDFTAWVGGLITEFEAYLAKNETLKKAFAEISNVVQIVISVVKELGDYIRGLKTNPKFIELINNFKWLGTVVSGLVKNGFNGILNFFKQLKSPKDSDIGIPKFKKLSDILDGILGVLNDVFGVIRNIWETAEINLGPIVVGVFGAIAAAIKTAVEWLKEFFERIKLPDKVRTAVRKILDLFTRIVITIRPVLDAIGRLLAAIRDKAVEAFSKWFDETKPFEKMGASVDGAKGGLESLATNIIPAIVEAIDKATYAITNLESVSDGFFGFIEEKRKGLQDFWGAVKQHGILGINEDNVDSAAQTLSNLQTNISAIADFTWSNPFETYSKWVDDVNKFGTFGDNDAVENFQINLETISSAITGFTEKVNWSKLGETAVVGGVLLDKILKMKFVSSFTKLVESSTGLFKALKNGINQVKDAAKLMFYARTVSSIAVGLLALAGAMWVMSQIPAERFEDIAGALAGFFVGFAIAMGIFAGMEKENGNVSKVLTSFGIALAGMGAGLLLLALSMHALALLDNRTMVTAAKRLALILFELAAAARIAGNAKGTMAFAGLAIGVDLLVFALKPLGTMDTDAYLQAAWRLALILAELALAARFAGQGKASFMTFIGMAVAIRLLVPALEEIGSLDLPTLAKAVGAIGILMVVMAGAARLSSGEGRTASKMVTMIIPLVAVAAILVTLSSYDWASLLVSAISLSVVLMAMAGALRLLDKEKVSFKSVGMLTLMLIPLLGVAFALSLLANYDWGSLLAAASAIVVVLAACGLIALFLSNSLKFEWGIEAAAVLIAMLAPVIGIAFALSILAQFDWENLKGATIAICSVLATCAVIVLVLGNATTWNTGAQAALALIEFIAIMIVFMEIMGKLLEYLDPTGGALDLAIMAFEKLGTAIGALVGGVVVGFQKAQADVMPGIAEKLTDFVTNIQGFVTGAKSIKGDEFAGFNTLISTIKSLGELKEKDVQDLPNVATSLGKLTEPLTSFVNAIGMISLSSMAKTTMIVTSIGSIGDTMKEHKISSRYAKSFGEGMTELLKQIGTISTDLKTLKLGLGDIGKITLITSAISMMADASKNIPKSTIASAGEYATTETIDSFAKRMSTTIGAIKEMTSGENGLRSFTFDESDMEKVTAVVDVIKQMSEAAKEIPNEGGALGWWVGENDIDTFAGRVSAAVPSITSMLTSLDEFNVSKIQKLKINDICTTIKQMCDAAGNIPNEGGALAWWVGENDIETFTGHIKEAVPNIISMYDSLKDFNPTDDDAAKLTTISKVISDMADVASTLNNYGGAIELFIGSKQTLSEFADDLKYMVESLITVDDLMAQYDNIGKLQLLAKAMGDLATTLGDNNINDTKNDLMAFGHAVTQFCTDFSDNSEAVDAVVGDVAKLSEMVVSCSALDTAAIAIFAEALEEAAKLGVDGFIRAFRDGQSRVSTAARNLIQAAADGAGSGPDLYNKFRGIGENAANGLAIGIETNLARAQIAAQKLANTAAQATAATLQEHSPSRVFRHIGEFGGEGFVNGIISTIGMVRAASEEMAESSVSPLRAALMTMANAVDDNLDITPTIRPVLDLSNLQNGAGQIGGMLGDNYGINTRPALAEINSAHFDRLNLENQNSPAELSRLVALNQAMLDAMRQGGDVYLNENLIVGRINRRLGAL